MCVSKGPLRLCGCQQETNGTETNEKSGEALIPPGAHVLIPNTMCFVALKGERRSPKRKGRDTTVL